MHLAALGGPPERDLAAPLVERVRALVTRDHAAVLVQHLARGFQHPPIEQPAIRQFGAESGSLSAPLLVRQHVQLSGPSTRLCTDTPPTGLRSYERVIYITNITEPQDGC